MYYLHTDTIAKQLARALKDRNQEAPNAGQLAFWHERHNKDMFVLKNGVPHYCILDITDGSWNDAAETILNSIR